MRCRRAAPASAPRTRTRQRSNSDGGGVRRAGGQAHGGAATQFEFVFPVVDLDDPDRVLYEERDSATVDASGNPFSTDPDRVGVGLVGGDIESGSVPWLRFTVTCGEEAEPWLVTPRIRREDLERVDAEFRCVVE